MTNGQIRDEVIRRINEAIDNTRIDQPHEKGEIYVMIPIPYSTDLIDTNDTAGIQLDNAKITVVNSVDEAKEIPAYIAKEISFPLLKVTGKVKSAEWCRCPHCGKALFPVYSDTKIEHMRYRCKACKNDIEINI